MTPYKRETKKESSFQNSNLRFGNLTLMMTFLAIVMIGCSKSGPPARTEAEVKNLLTPDWQEIVQKYPLNNKDHDGAAWSFRVTPPFPEKWPPRPDRKTVYYAYPEGMIMNGGDCLMIGKPWARVITDSGSPSNVRILRRSISKLETQGFRPLSDKEVAVSRASTAGPTRLRDLSSEPPVGSDDAKVVRDYYCGWLGGNGVIASQLEPSHSGFFTWLDCTSWKPVPVAASGSTRK